MTEGVSRGQKTQNRTCFSKNTLGSCGMNGNLNNVVLIDVDNDGLNDVIVIDAPEGLQQQCEGSRIRREVKRYPYRSIISIDDDDDDGDNVDQPGGNMESGGDSDATSRKSYPVFSHTKNSIDVDNDDCQVIGEKISGFKFSKCQKSYTWKYQCRNHYGLNNDSESDSSDSDYSDCEFMEGSSGKLHEQWEKASIRRKGNACDGNLSFDGQATATASHGDIHPNVEAGNRCGKHLEESPCSSSRSTNFEKDFFTSFAPTVGDASLDTHMRSDQKINQDVYGKDDVCLNVETCIGTNLSTSVSQNDDGCGSSGHDEQQQTQGLSSRSNGEHGNRQDNHSKAFHQDWSGNTASEHSFSNSQPRSDVHCDNFKASFQDEHDGDIPFCNGQDSRETDNIHHEKDKLEKRNEFFKEMPVSGEHLVSNAQLFDRTSFTKVASPSEYEVRVRATPDESISNCQHCEIQNQPGKPSSTESKQSSIDSTSTSKLCNGMDPLQTQGGDFVPAAPIDIINEREKLKKTDEYKRVVEEEWASRQRELKIQAEEAQRLRKRKKAESMRLLDMQRRQKQRVEEVRETQKKDEEDLNLKEKFRTEVRNELCKLEKMCIDMASLLRGLGIHVPGGYHPLSHEVNAAYKKALLRFHPDRASRTDIRQQVEAEEKFKLISRMKEKLLMTSCY